MFSIGFSLFFLLLICFGGKKTLPLYLLTDCLTEREFDELKIKKEEQYGECIIIK